MGDTVQRKIEIDESWSEEHAFVYGYSFGRLQNTTKKKRNYDQDAENLVRIFSERAGPKWSRCQVELASFRRKQSNYWVVC